MYILGIDQGIANLGYSIFNDEELITYGCINTSSNDILAHRFYSLYLQIKDIILKYNPEIICCEKLFYTSPKMGNRNKSASIIYTNMITGVLACLAGEFEIELRMFVPSKVKKAVCDNGKATKDDVINKIVSTYGIDSKKTKYEHVCDSIAIAHTCFIDNKENGSIRKEFEEYRNKRWINAKHKNDIKRRKLIKEIARKKKTRKPPNRRRKKV